MHDPGRLLDRPFKRSGLEGEDRRPDYLALEGRVEHEARALAGHRQLRYKRPESQIHPAPRSLSRARRREVRFVDAPRPPRTSPGQDPRRALRAPPAVGLDGPAAAARPPGRKPGAQRGALVVGISSRVIRRPRDRANSSSESSGARRGSGGSDSRISGSPACATGLTRSRRGWR